jgi:hypothetical protein
VGLGAFCWVLLDAVARVPVVCVVSGAELSQPATTTATATATAAASAGRRTRSLLIGPS